MTWPFENDTNAVTNKLAKKNLRAGRLKNLLIVLTIALSVALMSGLTLYIASMQVANDRQLETLQQVFFYDITQQQCEALRHDTRISEMRVTKYGKRTEIDNYTVWPMYIEQIESKITSAEIVEGHYPSAFDEIAVDKSYMKRIEQDTEIGSILTFQFFDGTQESFTVCGFTDTGSTSDVYPLYFSFDYASSGSQLHNMLFVAAAQIAGAADMSADEFLETIHMIGTSCGIDRPGIGENSAFVQSLTFNPKNMAIAFGIGLLVLLTGVIVVYSIFYVSIINSVQLFGQLRTIGTTSKQIKRIVKREGTLLFGAGAPIGLIFGAAFSFLLNPEGWAWSSLVLWGCPVIILDYIAVLYSVSKPAVIASRISPIEASKAKGFSQHITSSKRIYGKIPPHTMAKMNISRNRKKFLMTSFSLAISGIIFLTGSTFLSSFSQEDYARFGIMQHGEIRIYLSENAAQVNDYGYTGVQSNNPIDSKLQEKITLADGVNGMTAFQKMYVTFDYNGRRDSDFVVPMNEEQFSSIKQYLNNSELDYGTMVENREIIVLKNDAVKEIYGWKFEQGDEIQLEWSDGHHAICETYTIAGEITGERAYNDPQCLSALGVSGWFLMPSYLVEQILPDGFDLNSELLVSTDWNNKEATVTEEVKQIVSEIDSLQIRTLRDSINSKAGIYNSLLTAIIGISLFIMMFSLISLINTLVTNIMTRKEELSVLQSIGMTRKQLNKMLQYEGRLVSAWNIIITLLIGGSVGFLLIQGLNGIGMSYLHWNYPFVFAAAYAVIVIATPTIITKIAIQMLQNKSIVERLREVS